MKKHLPALIVLFMIALFPATLGKISPYYNTVLILIGIYVILAVSLDLLVGFAGQISVGHAAFFAIGAYTSGILTSRYHFSPFIAMTCGMCACALISWSLGRAVLRLKGYYLAMGTLGLNIVVVKLITGFASVTGGATGLMGIPPMRILGATLEDHAQYYYFVYAVVFLVVLCCLMLVKSPFGNSLIALHGDEEAASTLGIDCPKYKLHVFMISGIFAGVAGSLYAHLMGFIAPNDFGVFTSILLLVMLYLGGIGTIYGAALGAAFLKGLPEVTYQFQDYELFLYGLILILVLIFLPKGLLGIFSTVGRWMRRPDDSAMNRTQLRTEE